MPPEGATRGGWPLHGEPPAGNVAAVAKDGALVGRVIDDYLSDRLKAGSLVFVRPAGEPRGHLSVLLLEAAMKQSKKEHVFVGPRGKPYHTDSITHAFARACKKAKIVNLRFHDCRHHFATMVRRAGGDLDVVRQLLGHSHLSMTERYAHVGRAQLHAAVSKIGSDRIAQYNGQEGQKQEAEG
jgi:integrase